MLEVVQREALDAENFGTVSWAPKLDLVRWCYDRGVVYPPDGFGRRGREEPAPVPLELADQVLETPSHFPSFLLAIAEERHRQHVSSKVTPVAEIARREGWFSV